jgi:hypothetical protein
MSHPVRSGAGGDALDVSELQMLAGSHLSLQEGHLTRTELRIGAVVGDELPWRIVEGVRLPSGQLARAKRRLSFASRDALRQYLIEQVNWRKADANFM